MSNVSIPVKQQLKGYRAWWEKDENKCGISSEYQTLSPMKTEMQGNGTSESHKNLKEAKKVQKESETKYVQEPFRTKSCLPPIKTKISNKRQMEARNLNAMKSQEGKRTLDDNCQNLNVSKEGLENEEGKIPVLRKDDLKSNFFREDQNSDSLEEQSSVYVYSSETLLSSPTIHLKKRKQKKYMNNERYEMILKILYGEHVLLRDKDGKLNVQSYPPKDSRSNLKATKSKESSIRLQKLNADIGKTEPNESKSIGYFRSTSATKEVIRNSNKYSVTLKDCKPIKTRKSSENEHYRYSCSGNYTRSSLGFSEPSGSIQDPISVFKSFSMSGIQPDDHSAVGYRNSFVSNSEKQTVTKAREVKNVSMKGCLKITGKRKSAMVLNEDHIFNNNSSVFKEKIVSSKKRLLEDEQFIEKRKSSVNTKQSSVTLKDIGINTSPNLVLNLPCVQEALRNMSLKLRKNESVVTEGKFAKPSGKTEDHFTLTNSNKATIGNMSYCDVSPDSGTTNYRCLPEKHGAQVQSIPTKKGKSTPTVPMRCKSNYKMKCKKSFSDTCTPSASKPTNQKCCPKKVVKSVPLDNPSNTSNNKASMNGENPLKTNCVSSLQASTSSEAVSNEIFDSHFPSDDSENNHEVPMPIKTIYEGSSDSNTSSTVSQTVSGKCLNETLDAHVVSGPSEEIRTKDNKVSAHGERFYKTSCEKPLITSVTGTTIENGELQITAKAKLAEFNSGSMMSKMLYDLSEGAAEQSGSANKKRESSSTEKQNKVSKPLVHEIEREEIEDLKAAAKEKLRNFNLGSQMTYALYGTENLREKNVNQKQKQPVPLQKTENENEMKSQASSESDVREFLARINSLNNEKQKDNGLSANKSQQQIIVPPNTILSVNESQLEVPLNNKLSDDEAELSDIGNKSKVITNSVVGPSICQSQISLISNVECMGSNIPNIPLPPAFQMGSAVIPNSVPYICYPLNMGFLNAYSNNAAILNPFTYKNLILSQEASSAGERAFSRMYGPARRNDTQFAVDTPEITTYAENQNDKPAYYDSADTNSTVVLLESKNLQVDENRPGIKAKENGKDIPPSSSSEKLTRKISDDSLSGKNAATAIYGQFEEQRGNSVPKYTTISRESYKWNESRDSADSQYERLHWSQSNFASNRNKMNNSEDTRRRKGILPGLE